MGQSFGNIGRALKSDDDAVFDKEVRFDAADIEPMITYGTNPGMGMGITQHIPTMEGMSEAAQVSFKKSMEYMDSNRVNFCWVRRLIMYSLVLVQTVVLKISVHLLPS